MGEAAVIASYGQQGKAYTCNFILKVNELVGSHHYGADNSQLVIQVTILVAVCTLECNLRKNTRSGCKYTCYIVTRHGA